MTRLIGRESPGLGDRHFGHARALRAKLRIRGDFPMRRDDGRTDKQVQFCFHTDVFSFIRRGLSSEESTIYIVELRLV